MRFAVVAVVLIVSFGLSLVDGHMHHNLEVKEELLFSPQVWTQAMMATLLISAAPVLILLIIPVHNAAQNKGLLNILLAFAMGGLLGDVFLHLLPHSFSDSHAHDHHHDHHDEHHHHDHHHEHHEHHHEHEGHHHDHDEHNHEHEHHEHEGHGHSIEGVMTGLWIIVGIFVFLVVEKSIRNLTGGHGHSHATQPKEHKKQEKPKAEGMRNRKPSGKNASKKDKSPAQPEHQHVSKVSGFLNLAADFTHNFTDGLAIGATFVAGERMGMITTLAILLHEGPHEIGDFAILVSSGFTKWQAMKLQLVTAIGALIGTAVGIMTGGLASASNVILPVTAGGFIYISTVSVIPELLEDCSSTVQTILELLAGCTGVALMTAVALME